jgi:hypothetical protein
MSYDLMVFDPSVAPAGRSEFLAWYDTQTEWAEDHGYDDPSVSSAVLRAWFLEIISEFPAMNGPYASGNIDDDNVTDYAVGKFVIYAGFAWSVAETAYTTALRLAETYKVGFYDVSSNDGAVWLPQQDGAYQIIHRG